MSALIEKVLPLMPLQEGIFYECAKNPNDRLYHNHVELDLEGVPNVENLQKGIRELAQKNQALRTNVLSRKVRNYVQIVWKNRKIPFSFHDISTLPTSEMEAYADSLRHNDFENAYDLEKDPLIRIFLIKTAE